MINSFEMLFSNRKTGNGTSNRQWLYLYLHFPVVFLVKLGISGNYKRRAKQVGKQSLGWAIPIFAVKIPFAWQCEQAMHKLFKLFNFHFGGSKEWYLLPILPIAITLMLLAFILEWLIWGIAASILIWWLNN